MSDLAIAARGLGKLFDGRAAVAGLTMDVRRGEVSGFLGPNGAGKSTIGSFGRCPFDVGSVTRHLDARLRRRLSGRRHDPRDSPLPEGGICSLSRRSG